MKEVFCGIGAFLGLCMATVIGTTCIQPAIDQHNAWMATQGFLVQTLLVAGFVVVVALLVFVVVIPVALAGYLFGKLIDRLR